MADKKAAAPAKGKKTTKVKQMELPNAELGVVTRFPPEPSGYLHIGHAKAAMLNDYFAHIQYPGNKMILRFDDTNTEKETQEFVDSIAHDVELLGITPENISYTSNYFEEIEKQCVRMIQLGKAYADDTTGERMSEQRMLREPSVRRDESIDDNLKRFDLMRSGEEEGSKWCIRAKISVNSDNASLRDPVIYRVPKSRTPHLRTGTKFNCYPTYQFACPIVDSLEGITHALRTTEYNDQAQYKWILKALELRVPFLWTFSKIQFNRTLMSKRKLQKLVDAGVVSGWDDPRFPTVRGIRRRGMTVEGLRDFMVSQGPSKNVVNMDWHTIWAMNKKVIDQKAARFTAIDTQGAVSCKVNGLTQEHPYHETKPRHAKYNLGDKQVFFSSNILLEQADARDLSEGEEITLMNWGNVIVKSIEYQSTNGDADIADGVKNLGNVKSVTFDLHLEGDFKTTKKKITWLSSDQKLCPVTLVDFDYLLNKDKLSEAEEAEWEKFLTSQTEFKTETMADCNIWDVKEDDILQFDRKGYYRCDVAPSAASPGVFFKIPSGKE